jgi:hypothetical protein
LQCDAKELAVLLPRFKCGAVQRLTLSTNDKSRDTALTPTAVGALVSLLDRTPACEALTISGFSPPDPKSSPLLPALRNTAITTVRLEYDALHRQELVAWCAGRVGRPMVLTWCNGFMNGRLSRVYQALEDGGSDVTLELYFVDSGADDVYEDDLSDNEACDDYGCNYVHYSSHRHKYWSDDE